MITRKITAFLIFLAGISIGIHGKEYQTEEPSSWITIIEIPEYNENTENIINGEYYILSDMQANISPREFYNHYAIHIDNSTGLENNSQISIDFNPSYEELILHYIRVIRNGKTLDKLNDAITSVIQKENELEKLIYNGTKSFYAILSDMRVGDILEVSYTIKEEKPLFAPFSERFYIEWGVPVEKVYRRFLTDRADSLAYRFNGEEIKPLIKNEGKDYIWDIGETSAVFYDDNVPYWHDAHNYLEVSQYSDWEQVDVAVSDLYKDLSLNNEQAEYILSQYPQINGETGLEQTIEILLDMVQEDIRYMGIEIGRGSYIPTSPYDVFTRKFGDCKDKSLLLSELLNYKNVEAYPVLVHNSTGKALINALPGPFQFNHVIVKIIHNDRIYWFDPTFTYQEGTLNNLSEAPYEYGLVLSGESKSLEVIRPQFQQPNVTINETFTLPEKTDSRGPYTIETIYRNEDADYMRSYLSNSPHGTIAEELLDYMKDFYGDLSISKDFEFNDDMEHNIITLYEYYEIPGIWYYSADENDYQFTYSPFEIYNYTLEINELDRTMPYSIYHPVKIQQNARILLPETWNITNKHDEIKSDHFFYKQNIEYSDKELLLSYEYKSLDDSIAPEDLSEYNNKIQKINETIDYAIFWNHEVEGDNSIFSIRAIVISLTALAYLIIRLLKRKKSMDQIH